MTDWPLGFALTQKPFADSNSQRIIYRQDRDSSPTYAGQTDDSCTIPGKVLIPNIAAWMKEVSDFTGVRIHTREIWSLVSIAMETSQSEI